MIHELASDLALHIQLLYTQQVAICGPLTVMTKCSHYLSPEIGTIPKDYTDEEPSTPDINPIFFWNGTLTKVSLSRCSSMPVFAYDFDRGEQSPFSHPFPIWAK